MLDVLPLLTDEPLPVAQIVTFLRSNGTPAKYGDVLRALNSLVESGEAESVGGDFVRVYRQVVEAEAKPKELQKGFEFDVCE